MSWFLLGDLGWRRRPFSMFAMRLVGKLRRLFPSDVNIILAIDMETSSSVPQSLAVSW